MRPHRRQATRLPRPWDSPGKNTGVGCHFLLQCMEVKSVSEVAQSCLTLSDPMDCSLPGSSAHGIFQARVLEWVAIAFSEVYPITHESNHHIFYSSVLWISRCYFFSCGLKKNGHWYWAGLHDPERLKAKDCCYLHFSDTVSLSAWHAVSVWFCNTVYDSSVKNGLPWWLRQ